MNHVRAVTLLFFLSLFAGCSRGGDSVNAADERSAGEVVAELDAAPAWPRISDDDNTSKAALVSSLRLVAAHDEKIIRRGLERFLAKHRNSAGLVDPDQMSKIYILNRLLFNIPSAKQNIPPFGGWVGAGGDHPVWPLKIDGSTIALIGSFQGYFGPVYDALGEFDYLFRRYGIRHLTTSRVETEGGTTNMAGSTDGSFSK